MWFTFCWCAAQLPQPGFESTVSNAQRNFRNCTLEVNEAKRNFRNIFLKWSAAQRNFHNIFSKWSAEQLFCKCLDVTPVPVLSNQLVSYITAQQHSQVY